MVRKLQGKKYDKYFKEELNKDLKVGNLILKKDTIPKGAKNHSAS